MITRTYMSFTPETIFEKAVLHHYRDAFPLTHDQDPKDAYCPVTYLMPLADWQEHLNNQSDLVVAIHYPEQAARDLKRNERPKCHMCHGSGRHGDHSCYECDGTGLVPKGLRDA